MKSIALAALGALLLSACASSNRAPDASQGEVRDTVEASSPDSSATDGVWPEPIEPLPEAVLETEPAPEVVDDSWTTSDGADADDTACPVAVIQVEEGEQVIPQTVLHLHGEGSHSGAGAIVTYQWTVEQPAGSVAWLIPSATVPNPIFEASVAGKYVFSLSVIDQAGRTSCSPAMLAVYVVPDEAIHVELLWATPGDPDPTDEGPGAGTDLDLHVAHRLGSVCDADGDGLPEPWFDPHWDCYWANPHPDWGNPDPSVDDDPGLDRNDQDGGGPENVNLNIPEADPSTPFVYRVAVHYRDDHGFGSSFATLRIYIYSTLAFEVGDVEMQKGDLWEVATVEWPSTTIRLMLNAEGLYAIKPDYPEAPPCP